MVEETDEDLIERAEQDFYKVIEMEKKVRETKHAEANKALEDAKKALEKDSLPGEEQSGQSEQDVGNDSFNEDQETETVSFY